MLIRIVITVLLFAYPCFAGVNAIANGNCGSAVPIGYLIDYIYDDDLDQSVEYFEPHTLKIIKGYKTRACVLAFRLHCEKTLKLLIREKIKFNLGAIYPTRCEILDEPEEEPEVETISVRLKRLLKIRKIYKKYPFSQNKFKVPLPVGTLGSPVWVPVDPYSKTGRFLIEVAYYSYAYPKLINSIRSILTISGATAVILYALAPETGGATLTLQAPLIQTTGWAIILACSLHGIDVQDQNALLGIE